MSDEPMIGFGGGDDEDDMPPEMKAHMLAAFAHKAGLGPHPGMYQGPPRRKRVSDEPSDTDMQRAAEEPLEDEGRPHEASYRKMKAAQTGGRGLGPSAMETAAAAQTGAMQKQAETQGAAQAAQAQGGQPTIPPPPAAPGGPAGVSAPYAAQRGETPPGVPEVPEEGSH